MKLTVNGVEETIALGKKIGKNLKKGDILLLEGDLGAGKTTLTQGIAKGMGVEGYVKSPTFTYIIEYNGTLPLYHFDLYRLTEPQELYDLGFDDFMEIGVSVMEWGVLVEEMFIEEGIDFIKISLTKLGDSEREIKIDNTNKGIELYKELVV